MDNETKQEFVKVRSEFSEYQRGFDARLDDLFVEIRKPILTKIQSFYLVCAIVGYTFYITKDFSDVKSMAETTREDVNKQELQIKENNKENSIKTDKILEIVSDIKIDVAVLKEIKKDGKNPTSAQRQQMVLDWANGKN